MTRLARFLDRSGDSLLKALNVITKLVHIRLGLGPAELYVRV
jgi:hypothetical protein